MLVKNIKKTVFLLLITALISSGSVIAMKSAKTIKVEIPSVQCGVCKSTVEKALSKVKGVVSSNADFKKKIVTVKYNSHVTSPKKIRKAISNAGYQADDVKANKKAYKKLMKCCQLPDEE